MPKIAIIHTQLNYLFLGFTTERVLHCRAGIPQQLKQFHGNRHMKYEQTRQFDYTYTVDACCCIFICKLIRLVHALDYNALKKKEEKKKKKKGAETPKNNYRNTMDYKI